MSLSNRIKTAGAATLTGVDGWWQTQNYVDENGARVLEFTGRSDNLPAALAAVAAQFRAYSPTVTVTPPKAVIRCMEGSATDTPPPDNQTALPTVTLTGGSVSVPLHQAPHFGLGEIASGNVRLTLSDVRTVDYVIRQFGYADQRLLRANLAGGSGDLLFEYAAWIQCGLKTFEKPVYTLNVTFYYPPRKGNTKAAALLAQAGKIVTWAAALDGVPTQCRPPQPAGFDQWRALAPTISKADTGDTVSVGYVGAHAWPTYYEGGKWTPPALPYAP